MPRYGKINARFEREHDLSIQIVAIDYIFEGTGVHEGATEIELWHARSKGPLLDALPEK